MKIYYYPSPNFDKNPRLPKSIKVLVIHYTGMQSERESINRLCNPKSKVSSHFVINENGKVYRLMHDHQIAWHAGKSLWGNFKNLNRNSIGIELVNKGHKFGYTKFKKKQLSSLVKICLRMLKKYKIKKNNIVGHSDIAPLRKIDPGEKFPWEYLSKKKIGIWHNYSNNFLKKQRKIKAFEKKDKKQFIKNLKKIGYFVIKNNKFYLSKVVKAFQRHYRKELINGVIDKVCLIIAENLSKKL